VHINDEEYCVGVSLTSERLSLRESISAHCDVSVLKPCVAYCMTRLAGPISPGMLVLGTPLLCCSFKLL
jgi:hypothetical protein